AKASAMIGLIACVTASTASADRSVGVASWGATGGDFLLPLASRPLVLSGARSVAFAMIILLYCFPARSACCVGCPQTSFRAAHFSFTVRHKSQVATCCDL